MTEKPTGSRTKLPPEDFWKFRASMGDLKSIELEAREAADRFRVRVLEADVRARELFERLGKAHGFDPKKLYGWDDATCELIEIVTTT